MRVLEKDPDRRFQRASEVASEVERVTKPSAPTSDPIASPNEPISFGARIRRFIDRYRGMLIVTALVAIWADQALPVWLIVFATVILIRSSFGGGRMSRI